MKKMGRNWRVCNIHKIQGELVGVDYPFSSVCVEKEQSR